MKRKAFTLTELLVVVVILGVLATVAVPKFSRVLETRRTTEAENMLSAVRTEQEARCTMGKPYWGPQQEGQVQVLSKAGVSPNYSYELLAGGIDAQRPGKYTLRMWYKTGEICCEGEGCSELNKNYPTCGEAPADECMGQEAQPPVPYVPEPNCGEEPADNGTTESCGNCGIRTKTYTCDASTSWIWQAQWSSCQETAKPGDVGTTKACACGGTQTKDYQCVNNAWSAVWSDCNGGGGECEPGDEETKHCGPVTSTAKRARTCTQSCTWSDWGDCYCEDGNLNSKYHCCNSGTPYTNAGCYSYEIEVSKRGPTEQIQSRTACGFDRWTNECEPDFCTSGSWAWQSCRIINERGTRVDINHCRVTTTIEVRTCVPKLIP